MHQLAQGVPSAMEAGHADIGYHSFADWLSGHARSRLGCQCQRHHGRLDLFDGPLVHPCDPSAELEDDPLGTYLCLVQRRRVLLAVLVHRQPRGLVHAFSQRLRLELPLPVDGDGVDVSGFIDGTAERNQTGNPNRRWWFRFGLNCHEDI